MTCRMLTPKIESELGICVFGYVPKIADWHLESRHLGLVLPDEISDLREQMQRLADILEKTLDIESILQMAESAKEMEDDMPKSLKQLFTDPHVQKIRTQRPQIAVAKDEAASDAAKVTAQQQTMTKADNAVTVTNRRVTASPTGVMLSITPYALAAGLASALGALFFRRKKLS